MGIEYLIGIIVGAVVHALVSIMLRVIFVGSGVLRIDQSNPEKAIYRIELNELDTLRNKKRFILKVDTNAKLSQ